MKRLTLLRHAKSSRDDPKLSDFERPLNARGQAAAPLMASFMRDNGLIPDCILCSSAMRTRQTLDLLLQGLGTQPAVTFSDAIYLASPKEMLAEIKAASNDCGHILLIGHNPGMQMLALRLADPARSADTAIRRIEQKFPTAALAHFEFDSAAWKDVERGGGSLVFFKTPKELDPAPSMP